MEEERKLQHIHVNAEKSSSNGLADVYRSFGPYHERRHTPGSFDTNAELLLWPCMLRRGLQSIARKCQPVAYTFSLAKHAQKGREETGVYALPGLQAAENTTNQGKFWCSEEALPSKPSLFARNHLDSLGPNPWLCMVLRVCHCDDDLMICYSTTYRCSGRDFGGERRRSAEKPALLERICVKNTSSRFAPSRHVEKILTLLVSEAQQCHRLVTIQRLPSDLHNMCQSRDVFLFPFTYARALYVYESMLRVFGVLLDLNLDAPERFKRRPKQESVQMTAKNSRLKKTTE